MEDFVIDKENFHIFNYVKKEEYVASMDGMRYMLKKQPKKVTVDGEEKTQDILLVTIWPEPYCYAKTPEEKKQRAEFDFSAAGIMDAADWLNEQYAMQEELWKLSKTMM